MKFDIVKVKKEDFKEVLNDLTKDELISILEGLKEELEQDYDSFTCEINQIPFDRIRRITGYLVGTTERFNNAKKKEESDRVKHDI